MVQHALGVVVSMGGCLDAQVAQHGIGFPSAKELDGVLVNVGAQ